MQPDRACWNCWDLMVGLGKGVGIAGQAGVRKKSDEFEKLQISNLEMVQVIPAIRNVQS